MNDPDRTWENFVARMREYEGSWARLSARQVEELRGENPGVAAVLSRMEATGWITDDAEFFLDETAWLKLAHDRNAPETPETT